LGGGISPIVPSGYAPACDTRLTIGRLPSGPTSLAHNCSLTQVLWIISTWILKQEGTVFAQMD